MAQINLLKQKSSTEDLFLKIRGSGLKIVSFIALLFVAYYLWIFLDTKKVTNEIPKTKAAVAQEKKLALNMAQRKEFLSRQGQLKAYQNLSASHPYFSNFFKAIADLSIKGSHYLYIRVAEDGSLALSVNLKDNQELDKLLQLFDTLEFMRSFSNVKIGAINKIEKLGQSNLNVNFRMNFNSQILRKEGLVAQPSK